MQERPHDDRADEFRAGGRVRAAPRARGRLAPTKWQPMTRAAIPQKRTGIRMQLRPRLEHPTAPSPLSSCVRRTSRCTGFVPWHAHS